MMDDKAVLLDTNVLLAATVPQRPLHPASLVVLNDWPNQSIPLTASTHRRFMPELEILDLCALTASKETPRETRPEGS